MVEIETLSLYAMGEPIRAGVQNPTRFMGRGGPFTMRAGDNAGAGTSTRGV